jgi:anti-anti-sigma factor
MTTTPNVTATFREDPDRHAVVCTLAGKLIGKPASYAVLDEVRQHVEHGCIHVVVDLAAVDRIDSTGVGILASIYTSAHRRGGRVFVVNADARARDVLSIMRLMDFLETAESADAALGLIHRAV